MASKIRGGKSFRRIMKGMPDAMRGQIIKAFEQAGPELKTAMVAKIAGSTNRRTGALRAGIKVRILKGSLRLRVGFLGTPMGRARLFYARILEFGRKAQTVSVNRRRKGSTSANVRGRKTNTVAVYQMRVRAIAPKKFVTGRYTDLRTTLNRKLAGIWERSLKSIAGGSGND